jgi:hypothetical protein
MKERRQQIFTIFLTIFFFSLLAVFLLKIVLAEELIGPKPCDDNRDCPPNQYCFGGNPDTPLKEGRCNVPPPIWNGRGIVDFKPQDASFNITGPAQIANLQLGFNNQINNIAGGEVAINYGMGGKGFTVYNGADVPWFRVDEKGDVTVKNKLKVYGCFGPVFQRISETGNNGNAGGYKEANKKCPDGMHVCTLNEMLNSLNCGIDLSSLSNAGGVWISHGAPSLPTPTNDCLGWTSSSSEWYGINYVYSPTGGAFYAVECSETHYFACCQ